MYSIQWFQMGTVFEIHMRSLLHMRSSVTVGHQTFAFRAGI